MKPIIFLILLYSTLYCNANTKDSTLYVPQDNPKVFVYTTLGFYEIMVVGVGYNITDDWGVALKGTLFLFRAGGGPGVGIKIHKRLYKRPGSYFVDTINLEGSFGANRPDWGYTESKEIQINLASEKEHEKGINFYYSFGVGYTYKNRNGEAIYPVLKFGGIFNF